MKLQDDEALVCWGICVLANGQVSVWLQRAEPGRPGTAMMWLRDVCIGVWVQTLRWDTGTECLCSWLCSSLIEVSLTQQENWNSVFQHWAAYNKLFHFCTCLINTELFSVVTQCGFVLAAGSLCVDFSWDWWNASSWDACCSSWGCCLSPLPREQWKH